MFSWPQASWLWGTRNLPTTQRGKGELPAVKDTKEITAVVVQCEDFKQTVLGCLSPRELLGAAEALEGLQQSFGVKSDPFG